MHYSHVENWLENWLLHVFVCACTIWYNSSHPFFNKNAQFCLYFMQKEIEILRARLAVLEAKDQQLRREIQDQDQFIQMQDCELSTLLSWVSLGDLQEIGKALTETSKASQNIPCTLDLPESLKRYVLLYDTLKSCIKTLLYCFLLISVL